MTSSAPNLSHSQSIGTNEIQRNVIAAQLVSRGGI
jgi:hypothetical protein